MPHSLTVPLIILPHAKDLELPLYETAEAAGFDMRAAIAADAPLQIAPMQRIAVPTGLCFALPQGYEMQIRPRSGLALEKGITVLNSPGTIDSDYRGEIKILLINFGQENFTIIRGMRIAQAVITPIAQAKLRVSTKLNGTKRGINGFGSTGRY